MFKKYPNLSRLLTFVVLPMLALLCWVLVDMFRSVPLYSGQLELNGLDQQVQVTFNQVGSPSVVALSDKDAYFSQGYLHASERMWQMELQRRLISGRLSEVFGRSAVSTDVWMRTLGLDTAGANAWTSLSQPAQQALEAYSAGVNAWIQNTAVLPVEFMFFDISPALWQPQDSLAWQKVFALNLGLNMYEEINRLSALKTLSPEQLNTFYPDDPPHSALQLLSFNEAANKAAGDNNHKAAHDNSHNDEQIAYRFEHWTELAQSFADNQAIGGKNVGSNTWVVAGKHTASGAPLLASDPHLSIQQPSLWYAMQLKGKTLDVTGMSLVGMPGIFMGRNPHIAWGAASLMSDQQDLFVLDIPLGKGHVYMTPEGEKPFKLRDEVINIRSEAPQFLYNKIKPITITVRETEFGPVVSDVIRSSGYDLALKWTALDVEDRSFDAFYQLQYATNVQEFRGALKQLKSPGLHFVYADKQGNIATQVAAHLPKRGYGKGVLPNLAAVKGHQWQGYVDFDDLPAQLNPESGYLIAANNKVTSKDNVVISHEWAPDSRKNRIDERLKQYIAQDQPMTMEQMLALQMDQLDFGANMLLPLLTDEQVRALIKTLVAEQSQDSLSRLSNDSWQLLAKWQGEYAKDSAAASIYFYWLEGLRNNIFSKRLTQISADLMEPQLKSALTGRISEFQLLQIINDPNNQWCAPVIASSKAAKEQKCHKEIAESFIYAIKRLKKQTKSDDFDDWHWGRLHQVEFVHKPFGQVRLLDLFYKSTYPVGGSANTVNAANAQKDANGELRQTFGTAFRAVWDLAEQQQSAYALPGGQSGHLLSPYFDVMTDSFIEGGSYSFDANLADSSTEPSLIENTLILLPASTQPALPQG